MKTAIKHKLTFFSALLALVMAVPALAQMTVPGPGAVALPGQPTQPVPTSPVPEPVSSAPAMAAPTSLSSPAPAPLPSSGGASNVAKDVIDRIGEPTKDVTLEDLNAAREAIAKLDLLIDIEKRLTDLASLRKEREEKAMTVIAGALPVGALPAAQPAPYAPPPVLGGSPSDYGLPDQGGAVGAGAPLLAVSSTSNLGPTKIDVQKIMGAEGHYIAFVKDGDGRDSQVRTGDKMSDGSVVSSISRGGVTLSKGKKTSTFQVKDITKVFGGR